MMGEMHVVSFIVVLALVEYVVLGRWWDVRALNIKSSARDTGNPIFRTLLPGSLEYDGAAHRVRPRDGIGFIGCLIGVTARAF